MGVHQNYAIQYAPMNFSIRPTPSFIKIAMQMEVGSLLQNLIIHYEVPDLDTDCEMIWAGLHFSGYKPHYLVRFYKPPNTTSQPLEALVSSYNKLITLHKRSSPNIIKEDIIIF